MKLLLLLFLVCLTAHWSLGLNFHRIKRGGDLLGQLTQAIQQLTQPLVPQKPGPMSDPSFNSGPGSGTDLQPKPKPGSAPPKTSISDAIGYCKMSPQACNYLACLGENFKNGPQGQNMKQGSKVLADPKLRSAVANDPTILSEACNRAGLNDNGCQNFKMILDLTEKLDPQSAHTGDEPREKRSPVDYPDSHPNPQSSKTSSSNGNSKPAPSGSASKSAPSGSGPSASKSAPSGSASKSAASGPASKSTASGSASKSAASGSGSSNAKGVSDADYNNHPGAGPASNSGNSKPSSSSGSSAHGGTSDADYDQSHHSQGSSNGSGASSHGTGGGNEGSHEYKEKDCLAVMRGRGSPDNNNSNNNGNNNFNNQNNNNNNNHNNNNNNNNSGNRNQGRPAKTNRRTNSG